MTATIANDTIAREEQFQLATYKKMPLVAARGAGAWVETDAGVRYLDLYGGHAVCATGHCHPHVVAAIKRQAEQLLFYSNLVYSDVRAQAAEALVKRAPAPLAKAFFCNSGTEANENAMRMARMKTGRDQIITFDGSFHGRTADAISATFLGKYRELGGRTCPVICARSSVQSNRSRRSRMIQLRPCCLNRFNRWRACVKRRRSSFKRCVRCATSAACS